MTSTTTYRVVDTRGRGATVVETVRQNERGGTATARDFYWDHMADPKAPEAPNEAPRFVSDGWNGLRAIGTVEAPSAPSHGAIRAEGTTTDGRPSTWSADADAWAEFDSMAREACMPSVRARLARVTA